MTSGRQDRGSGPATPERQFTPPPRIGDADQPVGPAREVEAYPPVAEEEPRPPASAPKERGEAR